MSTIPLTYEVRPEFMLDDAGAAGPLTDPAYVHDLLTALAACFRPATSLPPVYNTRKES